MLAPAPSKAQPPLPEDLSSIPRLSISKEEVIQNVATTPLSTRPPLSTKPAESALSR